jgi:hypothetical protein
VEDCAGECGGSAELDECDECGGDGSSCGDDGGVTGLSATGGLNEVFLSWDASDCAVSYNVYNSDGDLIGSSPVNGFVDSGDGTYGLAYSTEYCYSVTAVNDSGEGSASASDCAETLPPYQAFLQVDASLANQEIAAVASPFGDLTGDGVADGVLMVNMVNLLPVNGYQFNFSLTPGIVNVIAAIDGNYLMSGGQGGLVAQMGAPGSSGIVIGFDALMTGASLLASLDGQLVADHQEMLGEKLQS